MKILGNRWVRYGLTLALLAVVILKVRPGHLLSAVGSARPEYVLAAAALTVPFLALKTVRWHLMLQAADVEASWGESALSLIGGMGLALVTPARLGELIRAAYLRDPQKLKIGGLVMIDKGFDVMVLCALSAVGAWRLLGPPAGAGLAVAAMAGLAVVYFPVPISRMVLRGAERLPMKQKVRLVVGSAESLSPTATTIFLALTIASFAVVMLQFGVILLSWRPWSLDIVLLTFPLVILTNVLPVTIGGLGIREGTAALLLAHYGVSSADAALTALLSSALNTYVPGLLGALLFPLARSGSRPVARPAGEP